MPFAFLTSMLWAFAGFGSSRLARTYGAAPGNALRLLCATGVLIVVTFALGEMVLPPGAGWFALSGILHLAIGDVALFAVYRRLGPRIGVLIVASLAPPVAMAVEWMALGTTVGVGQLVLATAVLVSVVLAVAPRERAHLTPAELRVGILAGILSTVGQGSSAAVTRMGYAAVAEAGGSIGPWMPTLLRCSAGAAGVLLWMSWRSLRGESWRNRPTDLLTHRRVGGHPMIWLAVSTLLGPVVGVVFYMLAMETTPAVLVQSVLATLPVMMIPVAWVLDGNAPSRRSVICGILAVGLAVVLILGIPGGS